MLKRREITRDNLRALLKLETRPDQENLVAPNAVTLAQAAYEPASHVWGLWDGDTPIGLIAMINMAEYPHREPGDDPNSAFLWRLMIAAEYQGQGYGRAAIDECKSIARSWGLSRLTASVVDAPNSVMGFYDSLGFSQTGDRIDGELVITAEV